MENGANVSKLTRVLCDSGDKDGLSHNVIWWYSVKLSTESGIGETALLVLFSPNSNNTFCSEKEMEGANVCA